MPSIEVEQSFPIPAEALWSRIGNTGDVALWIPAIGSSHMEDDIRHVVFTDGEPARERIVEYLEFERTYTYQYIDGPLPLQHYQSTISVLETGAESSVVKWNADFGAESPEVEADLATAIEGIYSDALMELKSQITGA